MPDFSRLPKGISSFPELRNSGRVYVDKTALIDQLIQRESFVFLSRPRRFGKSLLVSTLASLFEHGLRDFRGLTIEKLWKDKTYPVVKLDFSYLKGTKTVEEFKSAFEDHLLVRFSAIGFKYDKNLQVNFIEQLGSFFENPPCGRFVLLIDEYDAPLTEQLNDEKLFEAIRKTMAGFFSRIKGESGALRFLLITGITKYRQVSIFSTLNNLTDISLDPQFGELLGYTREETEKYFPEFLDNAVESLSAQTGTSYTHESLMQELIAHYDGFCFDRQASTHVFAPWSVLNFLSAPHNGFENYWIGSGGVSTWLVQWIRSNGMMNPDQFDQPVSVRLSLFDPVATPSEIPAEILLYQTGYLTIYEPSGKSLVLGYPNQEVSDSLAELYLTQFTSERTVANLPDITPMLQEGNTEEVMNGINRLLLAIPYDGAPISSEASVRGVVMAYILGAGKVTVIAERHNSCGRSDLELTVGDTHWVFEFKYVDQDAKAPDALIEALDQIQKKHYGKSSAAQELIRVGMVFSDEQRQIVAWKKAD